MSKKLILLTSFVLVLSLVSDTSGQVDRGKILFEYWMGIIGRTLDNLLNDPRYPDNPDGWEYRTSFQMTKAEEYGESFGCRVSGYLYPPATGDYTLWIYSDDYGQLLLSPDDDPTKAVEIASVPGWTNDNEWTKYPEQQSVPQTLEAGKKYYIEALLKEAGGGDCVGVGWAGPTIGTGPVIIDGMYLSPVIKEVHFQASDPDPPDGAIHPGTRVTLSWSPAAYAVSHNVYFGDNFDDVNDGIGGTFQGNQTTVNLPVGFPGLAYPEGFTPGVTYYWRVDEVNDLDPDSPWKGSVWSFTIAPATAYDPDPPDRAKFVDTDVTLGWAAGMNAKLHHVYFGDNFADVNNGTGGTYKGPVAGPTYTPGALANDALYYWRIDEFDVPATHKGDLWRFRTLPEITITDPNLVGWWKFDRGFGTTVLDWSGHGNRGTLEGDPQWVAGYDGDALELDGDDWGSINGYKGVLGAHAFSITAWIRAGQNGEIVGWGQPTNGQRVEFRIAAGTLRCENGGGDRNVQGRTEVWDNQWYHVAVTVKENATISYPDVIIYLDGQDDTIFSTYAEPFNLIANYDVTMGQRYNRSVARFFAGVIDDVRIYDKVLTAEEIKQTMRGDPTLAWNPKPTNGSTLNINDALPLSWSPGDSAAGHDVYLGTDRTAVADADTSTTGIYRGRQNVTSYTPPEGIEWGQSYYWRIDEYNTDATIGTGRVWSFTIADFILVDDFEDYDTGDNQIWHAWNDGLGYGSPPPAPGPYSPGNGTGSAVGDDTTASYTEETIVHGGGQAMPYSYDNNKQGYFNYSEVNLTLSYPRNWTEQGVGVLSMWFYGDPANAPEPMYVALANSGGTPAVVYHPDTNAAVINTWTQWNIDLTDFSNQGAVLTNVETISIGFGDRNNPQPGGAGTMYFDDIRLYRPR